MSPHRIAGSGVSETSHRSGRRRSTLLGASLWSTLIGIVGITAALVLDALDRRADVNIGLGMLLLAGLAITALGVVLMLVHLLRRAITAASRGPLELSRPEPDRPETP